MNRKVSVLSAVGMAATLVTACGDNHEVTMTPPPPAPTVQSLDTAAVLEMAKSTSETADPIAVDDGAVVLTDTSETTEPISVVAM